MPTRLVKRVKKERGRAEEAAVMAALKEEEEDETYEPKPTSLKEAILILLEEAGPKGLTVKELVERLEKKKWWDWNGANGYNSVYSICRECDDLIVRVAPGTYALEELQDGENFYVKPVTLKEVISILLMEAGAKGLTIRQMVSLISERNLWPLRQGRKGYEAVRDACCNSRDRSLFIRVAPGTYVLQSFYDQQKVYEQPTTLKEAIIQLLREYRRAMTVSELVRILEDKGMWDWSDVKRPSESVRKRCSESTDIFVKVAPGTYALVESQSQLKEESESEEEKIPYKKVSKKKTARKGSNTTNNSKNKKNNHENSATTSTETCESDQDGDKESPVVATAAAATLMEASSPPKGRGSSKKKRKASANGSSSSQKQKKKQKQQQKKKKTKTKKIEECTEEPIIGANNLLFLNSNNAIGAS